MRKGQTSLEFLMTLVFAALVFSVFYVFIIGEFSILFGESYVGAQAEVLAEEIAAEINYAYISGDGYSANITLPEQISGRDYIVVYNSTYRVVEVDIVEEEPLDEDDYGASFYLPYDVELVNISTANLITNSKGKIVVRGVA